MADELCLQWEMPDDLGNARHAILAHEFSPDRKIHAYATNGGIFFHDRDHKRMLWSRTLDPAEPLREVTHFAISNGPNHLAIVNA